MEHVALLKGHLTLVRLLVVEVRLDVEGISSLYIHSQYDDDKNNNNNNNTAGCVEVCSTDPLRGLLHPDCRGGQVLEHEV